jgi:hypothetical protein
MRYACCAFKGDEAETDELKGMGVAGGEDEAFPLNKERAIWSRTAVYFRLCVGPRLAADALTFVQLRNFFERPLTQELVRALLFR